MQYHTTTNSQNKKFKKRTRLSYLINIYTVKASETGSNVSPTETASFASSCISETYREGSASFMVSSDPGILPSAGPIYETFTGLLIYYNVILCKCWSGDRRTSPAFDGEEICIIRRYMPPWPPRPEGVRRRGEK